MIYPVAIIVIAGVVVGVILWKVIPTFADPLRRVRRRVAAADPHRHRPQQRLVALHALRAGGDRRLDLRLPRLLQHGRRPHGRGRPDAEDARARAHVPQDRRGALLPHAGDAAGVGVPILEALDITARTAGNAVVERALNITRKSIEGGETIAVPLKETGVFPPMVVQMIGVGEATGALDTMLGKIAEFYEEEVDVAVAGLLTLLERR